MNIVGGRFAPAAEEGLDNYLRWLKSNKKNYTTKNELSNAWRQYKIDEFDNNASALQKIKRYVRSNTDFKKIPKNIREDLIDKYFTENMAVKEQYERTERERFEEEVLKDKNDALKSLMKRNKNKGIRLQAYTDTYNDLNPTITKINSLNSLLKDLRNKKQLIYNKKYGVNSDGIPFKRTLINNEEKAYITYMFNDDDPNKIKLNSRGKYLPDIDDFIDYEDEDNKTPSKPRGRPKKIKSRLNIVKLKNKLKIV